MKKLALLAALLVSTQAMANDHVKVTTITSEGQTVLDNTTGAASTLIAAAEIGRYCIGMESDPEIYKTAKARLAA